MKRRVWKKKALAGVMSAGSAAFVLRFSGGFPPCAGFFSVLRAGFFRFPLFSVAVFCRFFSGVFVGVLSVPLSFAVPAPRPCGCAGGLSGACLTARALLRQQQVDHAAVALHALHLAVCLQIGVVHRGGDLGHRSLELLPVGAVRREVALCALAKLCIDGGGRRGVGGVERVVGMDEREHEAGVLQLGVIAAAARQISGAKRFSSSRYTEALKKKMPEFQ